MKKKIDAKVAAVAVLGMLVVALIIVLVLFRTQSNKQIEALQTTVEDKEFEVRVLQTEIETLGQTTTVYRVKRDVKSNTLCSSDVLEEVEVPTAMAGGYATKLEDIVGKYFIIDVADETPVTEEMVFTKAIKSDDRYLDVICDRQPVGFDKGSTVDVRVTFPDGQDFLLLDGKLVEMIYGNVVRIMVDEKDIIIYQGAEADWCRFYKNADIGTAVRIYCVEHIQGALQSASRYYPIADVLPDGETFEGSVLWTALYDPTLKTVEADLKDWTQVNRKDFEAAIGYYDQYRLVKYDYEVKYYEISKDPVTGEDTYSELLTTQVTISEDDLTDSRSEEDAIKTKLKARFLNEMYFIIKEANVVNEYVTVDMRRGAEKVAKAKTYRDDIYMAALEAYNENMQAMYEAMAIAEEEGLEFDPNTWRYKYDLYKKRQQENEDPNNYTIEDGVVF